MQEFLQEKRSDFSWQMSLNDFEQQHYCSFYIQNLRTKRVTMLSKKHYKRAVDYLHNSLNIIIKSRDAKKLPHCTTWCNGGV